MRRSSLAVSLAGLLLVGAGCAWPAFTPDDATRPRPIPPPDGGAICVNTCGNGSCEEIVCMGNGCPCAESASSCPQDCGRPVTDDCAPRGDCREGQDCPAGTSCSGLPAYGCYPDGCPTPICLAAGSRIATPFGEMDVAAVRPGMAVWTPDGRGGRTVAPVLRVGSAEVGDRHAVVVLTLSDGRVARVSPGHPTVDGRGFETLRTGDAYDGAVVVDAEPVPYDGTRTYDLLPGGPTGAYWVDGIRMGSTLER